MINFIYNPIDGEAVPDGKVNDMWNSILKQYPKGEGSCVFSFSTENMIHRIRVAMRQGEITCENICIFYCDKLGEVIPIKLYPSGGMTPYPDGFMDTTDKLLMELL